MNYYVDGSYDKDLHVSGYSAICVDDDSIIIRVLRGQTAFSGWTNMRNVGGELLAALAAVNDAIAHGYESVEIFHDYTGIQKWADEEWKCNNPYTELYHDIMSVYKKKIAIKFFKIRAHTGVKFNEMADQCAKVGYEDKNNPFLLTLDDDFVKNMLISDIYYF